MENPKIDLKKIEELAKVDFILWVKFNDGNVYTHRKISYRKTISQMYFGKAPIDASLKSVWDVYQYELNVSFKGRWKMARIYSDKSIDSQDFIAEYRSDGGVKYRVKGLDVPGMPIDFDSDSVKMYERRLNLEMYQLIEKFRKEYGYKANKGNPLLGSWIHLYNP